ncbi:MAG: sigma 54-interacting transcriptional regulator [Myxococcota bacterium]
MATREQPLTMPATPADGDDDAPARAFLVVYQGGRSRLIDLDEGTAVTVGRSAEATIVLEDTKASRLHARIQREGAGALVEDLGSTNGTFLNGARVRGSARVAPGDELRVGEMRLVLGLSSPRRAIAPMKPEAPIPAVVEHARRAAKSVDRRALFVHPSMHRVRDLLRRVAPSASTVLLLGETGVGKEIVAHELHAASQRRGPFLQVSCAAIPSGLVESELFGHERGAFTGAERRRAGFFEAAAGGTLLLDEVGDLPLETQSTLLRVLDEHAVTRVGGTARLAVDTRVVAATHRDLEAMVRAGSFREDLFFRLAVFVVYVPPLRERRAEILPLARLFCEEAAAALGRKPPAVGADVARLLERHLWPGNVRELRNAVERAVSLSPHDRLAPEALPESIVGASASLVGAAASSAGSSMRDRLESVERQGILDALRACGGNQSRAATRLGLSRRALIYKLRKYGLGSRRGGYSSGAGS